MSTPLSVIPTPPAVILSLSKDPFRVVKLYLMSNQFWIYIMASRTGTLYIGVTNDLERRVYEHKSDLIPGFTRQYQCHKLVYFEEYLNIDQAIQREKQLKGWSRGKKESLIKTINPSWKDLSP